MNTKRCLQFIVFACAALLTPSPAVNATEFVGKGVLSGEVDAVISVEGMKIGLSIQKAILVQRQSVNTWLQVKWGITF